MFLDSRPDCNEHVQNIRFRLVKQQGGYASYAKKFKKTFCNNNLSIYKPISILWRYYLRLNTQTFYVIRNWSPFSTLEITEAMRGTSREQLYHTIGLESLESRRQYHKLCCFYKIVKIQSTRYLLDVIRTAEKAYIAKNDDKLPHLKVKHN